MSDMEILRIGAGPERFGYIGGLIVENESYIRRAGVGIVGDGNIVPSCGVG